MISLANTCKWESENEQVAATCKVLFDMQRRGSWNLPSASALVGDRAFTLPVATLCQYGGTRDSSVALATSSSQLFSYVDGLCDGNYEHTRCDSKGREQVRNDATELPPAMYATIATNMSAFLDIAQTQSSDAESTAQVTETRTAAATHSRGQGGMAVLPGYASVISVVVPH